ncbi:MAG: dTMP kinase [Myxococcales bacterium]|nr:dTMP kinase [Myxococcales bacterium]
MSGSFVVLEGIDGSGTTTQASLLNSWLVEQGVPSRLTREPSDGPIGSLIRLILKGRIAGSPSSQPFDPRAVALLFAADRLDHIDTVIAPEVRHGTCVISDRYVASSLAYQSVDVDAEWVKSINLMARQPDLTIFLRVGAEAALERITKRQGLHRDLYETLIVQKKVAERYEALLADGAMANAKVLDGTKPVAELALEIRRVVAEQVLEVKRLSL